MRSAPVLLLLLAATAGCSDILGSGSNNPRVTTDQTAYTAVYLEGEGAWERFGFEIVVRTENRGRSTVYLERCNEAGMPAYGIVQVNEGADLASGSAYSPVWACPAVPPIPLVPGEVRTDTIRLSGPNGWDGHTGEVLGSMEGIKEFSFSVRRCPECLPSTDLGRSNRFVVTTARE